MKIGIIGRTEILYNTALLLDKNGYDIAHIITSKEAPEYKRSKEDFKNLANKLIVPFSHTHKIIHEKELIFKSKHDVGISFNYTGILPQEIIDCYSIGVLNAHGGDLPRYRGNACQAWAILNGEKKIGLCIHKMIGDELDSGDIISRDYLPIDNSTKVEKCWEWMTERIPELFLDALINLGNKSDYFLEKQSTNPSDILRCYPRLPEDGCIDWTKPSLEILRLINACNRPYAGAYCNYEGKKMIIWDAELVEGYENFCAVPGQIIRIGEGFVEVACGKEKLKINQVEYNEEINIPNHWIRSIRKRLR